MAARNPNATADLSSPDSIEAETAKRFKTCQVPDREPEGCILANGREFRRWGSVLAFDDRAYRLVDQDNRPATYLATHLFGRLAVVA
jgi:hypothetical protein